MTMKSTPRYRERGIPQVTGARYNAGTTQSEKWSYTAHDWVPTGIQRHFTYIDPIRRFYKELKRCSDYVNTPGPPYKFGNNFDLLRGRENGYMLQPLNSGGWVVSGAIRRRFSGGFCPKWYPPHPYYMSANTSQIPKWDLADLSSYGPQAYQKYSPVKPKVDLGQFFAEFREIPKMLFDSASFFKDIWKQRGGKLHSLSPKPLANEFLNYNFGWVPFIGSLLDFHRVMSNLHTHVRRIIDHNNKWEHRGGPVEEELISEELILDESTCSKTYPSLNSIFKSTEGWTKVYKRVYRQVWFSGYFKYHIPNLNFRSWWQPEIFKMILGLKITPSLLWEITPFSWLFDWFGNVGDILANASDAEFYNLVSRNAFLMGRSQVKFDFTCYRNCGNSGAYGAWTWSYERKQRTKASPYGFGVRFTDLSAKQIAILGALGVSNTELRF